MTLFAGRFDMIKLLGRGGMAEVWLAEQKGMSGFARRVVIKQMMQHLARDREFVRRFEDEARIAALISHANVVRVEDFGEENGLPFLVMEYIEGHDLVALSERAHAQGVTLPIRLVVQIGVDIARGLNAVHLLEDLEGNPLRVVHRDVSPQNIMLDGDGRAKLLDFGVARAATNKVKTQVGILKGKIAYFSPEQSRGEPLDGRSDQFALAVVLWELLTGHRLFLGANDVETLQRVRLGTVPRVENECPQAPQSLRECLHKGLSDEPFQRFPDCASFAAHLERSLNELGGRLDGTELEQVVEPLSQGERVYLPSIPLPNAGDDTAFSQISSTDITNLSPEVSGALKDDPLTVISQPGFLADFEDETKAMDDSATDNELHALRSLPSEPQAEESGLQRFPDDDLSTTAVGRNEGLRPSPSSVSGIPTEERFELAAEYTNNDGMGGPWLSLALILAIGVVAGSLFFFFNT